MAGTDLGLLHFSDYESQRNVPLEKGIRIKNEREANHLIWSCVTSGIYRLYVGIM